jgi:hypothetical protein
MRNKDRKADPPSGSPVAWPMIPGWSFYFLEEKLVPDEFGNAAVD